MALGVIKIIFEKKDDASKSAFPNLLGSREVIRGTGLNNFFKFAVF
jgi:hypothetical protein